MFICRLNNLFNGLDESSPLRYVVYTAIIKLSSSADLLQLVNPKLEELKQWFAKWDIGIAKVQTLLRTLYDAFIHCKQKYIIIFVFNSHFYIKWYQFTVVLVIVINYVLFIYFQNSYNFVYLVELNMSTYIYDVSAVVLELPVLFS